MDFNKYLKNTKNIKTIEDLKNFFKEYFKEIDVKVYLFGSRATGKNTIYSDIISSKR